MSYYQSRFLNLQQTLTQILPPQHAQEAVNCVLHADGDVVDALQTPFLDPAGHVLIPRPPVLYDVGVEDQEPLPPDAPAHDLAVVFDARDLRRGRVVGRDGATSHCFPARGGTEGD